MLVPAPAARPEEQHVPSQHGCCWRMCPEGLSGTGRQQGAPELSSPPPRALLREAALAVPLGRPGSPYQPGLRVHMAGFHVVDLSAFSIGLCQN